MNNLRIINRNGNITIFNPATGEIIIDGNGACDTPVLLDVSLTNKCSYSCAYCYKNSSPEGTDMSMDDFELLIKKMKEAKIFQVAYGGGNPNEHPCFNEILRKTREAGIIPNYSTNGSNLSDEIIEATSKYCGAIAISIHKSINEYKGLILKLTSKIKKVNLHFVMTKSKANEIVKFLERPPQWANKINAIVLLRYKNVRFSAEEEPDENGYRLIFEKAKSSKFKVAFDACSYPLIRKFLPSIDKNLYDYCQGGRSSAYINEFLIMSPCSFDLNLDQENDLHRKSIREIFNDSFSFRNRANEIEKYKICIQHFDNK